MRRDVEETSSLESAPSAAIKKGRGAAPRGPAQFLSSDPKSGERRLRRGPSETESEDEEETEPESPVQGTHSTRSSTRDLQLGGTHFLQSSCEVQHDLSLQLEISSLPIVSCLLHV